MPAAIAGSIAGSRSVRFAAAVIHSNRCDAVDSAPSTHSTTVCEKPDWRSFKNYAGVCARTAAAYGLFIQSADFSGSPGRSCPLSFLALGLSGRAQA